MRGRFSLHQVNLQLYETDKAYIAGLIDGEGCLTIVNAADLFIAKLTISNTDKNLLEYIQELIPDISLQQQYRKSQDCHNKPLYQLYTSNQCLVYAILKEVYPYLISKKVRAGILLYYLEVLSLPDNTSELKYCIEEIRKLNKKGIPS